MVGKQQLLPVEEKIKYQDEVVREQEELEKTTINTGSLYQLFYLAGGILTCLVLLVISGFAVQIKERNHLEGLLNEQSARVSVVQRVYIVEEGETLEDICIKLYGDGEREQDIRLLNGLTEEEEPGVGERLFLP